MASKGKQGRPEGNLVTVPMNKRPAMRAQREKMGLTQKDVAKTIGVSPGTISNIESRGQPQMESEAYARWLQLLEGRALAGGEEERTAFIARLLRASPEMVPGIIKLVDPYLPPEEDTKEGGDDKARLGSDRPRTPRGSK